MNFENNKNKVQSVKCNFPPGGQSNFQMGWGMPNDPVSRDTKISSKNYASNCNTIINNSDKENVNKVNIIAGMSTQSKESGYGKAKFNIFNDTNYSEKTPSIKISQNPGGKSNLCFGNDSSNYEEYRRKK